LEGIDEESENSEDESARTSKRNKRIPKIGLRDILPYCENNLCLTPRETHLPAVQAQDGIERRVNTDSQLI